VESHGGLNAASGLRRQDDVAAFYLGDLVKQGAVRVPEPVAFHRFRECLPHGIGQKRRRAPGDARSLPSGAIQAARERLLFSDFCQGLGIEGTKK
jgi:hypothetical protein